MTNETAFALQDRPPVTRIKHLQQSQVYSSLLCTPYQSYKVTTIKCALNIKMVHLNISCMFWRSPVKPSSGNSHACLKIIEYKNLHDVN